MAGEPLTVRELADEVIRARDGLVARARRITPNQWRARPLDGDDRPIGVVVDHVADSYGYLGRFVRQLLVGEALELSAQIIDDFNARHATEAVAATPESAIAHLQENGDAFAALIRPLAEADLDRGDGRVRGFALIAIRHADNHGTEIEAALPAASVSAPVGADQTGR
jgi:DinB superfamily